MRAVLNRGFTLIEVMIVVAIVAILATVAFPAYTDYMRRGQLPEAFTYLSEYRVKMEQYYQDNRNYGGAACGVVLKDGKYFKPTCTLANNGQEFTVKASGLAGSRAAGYDYTVDHAGAKGTTKFAGVAVNKGCWAVKAGDC